MVIPVINNTDTLSGAGVVGGNSPPVNRGNEARCPAAPQSVPVYSPNVAPTRRPIQVMDARNPDAVNLDRVIVATSDNPQAQVDTPRGRFSIRSILTAGLTGAVSSALTFGMRAMVAAAVLEAIRSVPKNEEENEAGGVGLSTLYSNLISGVFVGLIHGPVGASVGGYLRGKLEQTAHKDTAPSPFKQELNDAISVSLPIVGAFTGTFAAGGALRATFPDFVNPSEGIWSAAGQRALSSTAGGIISGMVSDIVKSSMKDYQPSPSQSFPAGEIGSRLERSMQQHFCPQTGGNKSIYLKHGLGKVVGGVLGMAASTYAGKATFDFVQGEGVPADDPNADIAALAAANAAGLLAFLGAWFTSIHAGGLIGAGLSSAQSPSAAVPELIELNDMTGTDNEGFENIDLNDPRDSHV